MILSKTFCGPVIYRHPNGNADTFISFINSSIDKIHIERAGIVLFWVIVI
jgi:hypothetical protein